MPDFTKAQVSDTGEDLSAYQTFLKRLAVGQVVTLPLEGSESSRRVMRSLNAAAQASNMRLARLPAENGAVRFRVIAPEKRQVNMSEEARRARVERARATRAARRQVGAMGLDGLTADPTGHQGDQPLDAAPPVQDVLAEQPDTTQIEAPVETDQAHPGEALGEPLTEDPVTHEFLPPEQQVREPDAGGAPAKRSATTRRRSRAAGNRNGTENA